MVGENKIPGIVEGKRKGKREIAREHEKKERKRKEEKKKRKGAVGVDGIDILYLHRISMSQGREETSSR